jgi:uncharacterized protein YdhG (YjbR/CyaY superfamily)
VNKATTVEEYLAAVPEPHRTTLETLRARIRAAVPEGTTERLSYGMPSFHNKKGLVCYAAFKNHCSLFPMSGRVLAQLGEELAKYRTSKGTLQFAVDKPLPAALIKKILKVRLEEIEGASTGSARGSAARGRR